MGTKGYWLNERRLLVYSRLCVAMYAVGLLSWLMARVWLAEAPITTLQNDFAGLWSVGHMVLQGRASEAYLPDLALAAQAAFVPEHEVRLPWFYPPHMFVLVAPLAALPYLPAFFLWTGGGLACLAWSIRALAPNTPAVWLLLASPGLIWLLTFGQTGVLAAALLCRESGRAISCSGSGRCSRASRQNSLAFRSASPAASCCSRWPPGAAA
jgi:hypothetical protein